jgi:hypothetical protein
MFSNNYFKLNDSELKIFKQLQYIFNEYLYKPRATPINTDELYNDLKILGNLIHNVGHGKRKIISSERSLQGGNKTRKNKKTPTTTSSIFKRKKFVKRFKKPFFLSLK